MFKIKGYIYSKGASTSKYDAPPYIERNTKNLDIISRVKENITLINAYTRYIFIEQP